LMAPILADELVDRRGPEMPAQDPNLGKILARRVQTARSLTFSISSVGDPVARRTGGTRRRRRIRGPPFSSSRKATPRGERASATPRLRAAYIGVRASAVEPEQLVAFCSGELKSVRQLDSELTDHAEVRRLHFV
jgi:hypothetical protein